MIKISRSQFSNPQSGEDALVAKAGGSEASSGWKYMGVFITCLLAQSSDHVHFFPSVFLTRCKHPVYVLLSFSGFLLLLHFGSLPLFNRHTGD